MDPSSFGGVWSRFAALAALVLGVVVTGFIISKSKIGLFSGTNPVTPPIYAAAGVPVKVEITASPLDVSAGNSSTITIKLLDANNLLSEGGNRNVILSWAPKDPFVQASGETYTVPNGASFDVVLQVKPTLAAPDDVPITATWTDSSSVAHTSVVTIHVHP